MSFAAARLSDSAACSLTCSMLELVLVRVDFAHEHEVLVLEVLLIHDLGLQLLDGVALLLDRLLPLAVHVGRQELADHQVVVLALELGVLLLRREQVLAPGRQLVLEVRVVPPHVEDLALHLLEVNGQCLEVRLSHLDRVAVLGVLVPLDEPVAVLQLVEVLAVEQVRAFNPVHLAEGCLLLLAQALHVERHVGEPVAQTHGVNGISHGLGLLLRLFVVSEDVVTLVTAIAVPVAVIAAALVARCLRCHRVSLFLSRSVAC